MHISLVLFVFYFTGMVYRLAATKLCIQIGNLVLEERTVQLDYDALQFRAQCLVVVRRVAAAMIASRKRHVSRQIFLRREEPIQHCVKCALPRLGVHHLFVAHKDGTLSNILIVAGKIKVLFKPIVPLSKSSVDVHQHAISD